MGKRTIGPSRMHFRPGGNIGGMNEATLGVVLEATATPAEVTVAGERLSVIG